LLRDLDREAFAARLAYYLGEVNAVHPFREGNGRTQRAFFEQLAREAGYTLAWQHLDAARNIEASVQPVAGAVGWPGDQGVEQAADLAAGERNLAVRCRGGVYSLVTWPRSLPPPGLRGLIWPTR
jgi:fido (protein-threonine AMPylation protein)